VSLIHYLLDLELADMQNFSLNVKQSAAIKSVDDASKNAVNANKLNQNTSNTQENSTPQNTFQTLLNKQVQAKRAQENAVAAKLANKPVTKNSDVPAEKNVATQVENLTEKKSVNEEAPSAIEGLSAQLAFQIKDKSVDAQLLVKDEDKRKITEDAAILATMMQEVNRLTPQSEIDPAALKMYAQGVSQSELNQSAGKVDVQDNTSDGISEALQTMTNSGFGKEFLAGFATNQVKPASENTSQTLETTTKESDFFKDTLSSKFANADSQISDEKSAQTFNALNSESLKTFSNKENLLKEFATQGDTKELNAVSATQNFQQSNVALNNSVNAASQLASSNQILAPFGKSGWDQAISQKVVWMVGAGEQSATLTLNPPDLGPVQVVISVNNDKADTTFISDNADVRQALQDGLEHLREKMEASGIQLGQANVNSGQQSQQSFQEAAQQQFSGQAKANISSNPVMPLTPVVIRESNGLVDTFA